MCFIHIKTVVIKTNRQDSKYYHKLANKQAALDLLGNKCQNCGNIYALEFAHKKKTDLNGRGRGSNDRYLDVLRHPDSYILLCKPCHTDFDSGRLNIHPEI